MLKAGGVAAVLLLVGVTEWSIGFRSLGSRLTGTMNGRLAVVQREIGPQWHLSTRGDGRLTTTAVANHPLDLRAGMEYQIVAVCDENCSQLTFALFDENGREVDRDIRRHTWPSLHVIPVRSATFQLTVSVADCRRAPCAYGIGLFSRAR